MRSVEEEIRRAIEEGKFDNLPGKGKPLRLDEDVNSDPEWRTAFRMLKNAGFTLPWIEKRQEIEVLLEKARSDLRRAWAAHESSGREGTVQAEGEWVRAVELFQERMTALNRRIYLFNLDAPSDLVQMAPLRLQNEIERARGAD